MKKIVFFFAMLFCTSVFAGIHVVLVSPRGETKMETIYKEELQRLLPNKKLTFVIVKPDVNQAEEMQRLPGLVINLKPDLIYTWGTPTTLAIAGTTTAPIIKNIPIVFTTVAYPHKAKLLAEYSATSNRNLTGVQHLPPMRYQLLSMQTYKKFKTVGVVYNPTEPNAMLMLDELKTEVNALGLTLIAIPVDIDLADKRPIAKTIPKKIEYLKRQHIDWLYLGPDTFVAFTHRGLTTFTATVADIPTFTANESAIRSGHALYGVFSPIENLAKLTAQKSAEVLSGKRPISSIPVETLQKFVHVFNLCTANSIKMYPPMYMFKTGDIILPKVSADDLEGCVNLD